MLCSRFPLANCIVSRLFSWSPSAFIQIFIFLVWFFLFFFILNCYINGVVPKPFICLLSKRKKLIFLQFSSHKTSIPYIHPFSFLTLFGGNSSIIFLIFFPLISNSLHFFITTFPFSLSLSLIYFKVFRFTYFFLCN